MSHKIEIISSNSLRFLLLGRHVEKKKKKKAKALNHTIKWIYPIPSCERCVDQDSRVAHFS
jgi:hypothetical protein